MLSWLHPNLLWALPLAAAPVLLHLIFMRRARRLPFSDLSLLRAAYTRSLPSSRLRQWLLMLLRVLILAGIVLAFARPVLHRRAAAGDGDAGLDVVLLLDTSWSMGAKSRGKTRFDWAVSAGSGLLAMLRPADRVAVGAFSEGLESELSWLDGPAAAEEALHRHRLGFRTTDAGAALAAAYGFLSSAGGQAAPRARRRRIVVLLSDGAAHSLRSLPGPGVSALPGYDPEVQLLGLSWDGRPDNAGLLEVRPSPEPETGRLAVSAAPYYFGAGLRDTRADLWLRGLKLDPRSLQLRSGAEPPSVFRFAEPRDGAAWGRLELQQDDLPADDVFYFSMRVQRKPRVLLLYGNPEYLGAGNGGYFLKNLLSEGERLPFRLDIADFGRLDQVRMEDYGVVVLADFRSLPAGLPESLERYVARGGGLLLLAGTRADPETYRPLHRLLPGELGPAQTLPRPLAIRPAPGLPPPSGERAFTWDEFEISRVQVERRYGLAPRADASAWFLDGSGDALMLAGSFGEGRVLLWASALDLGWSNIAVKPAFTAWVETGLRWLSRYGGTQNWQTVALGQPFVRVWRPGEEAPSEVQVRSPGGRRTALVVRDRRAEYTETREPGLYTLQPLGHGSAGPEPPPDGPSAGDVFAVNLDRSGPEGDLTPSSRPPWAALRREALREDFLRVVYGREVRSWFLSLVLALSMFEFLLSRPRAEKRPRVRRDA